MKGRHSYFEIAAPEKQVFPQYCQLCKAKADPRFTCGFQNSVRLCVTELCRQQGEVIQSDDKTSGGQATVIHLTELKL